MPPELHFFVGKGGVGKSTTSALTALHLASSGHDTLLVSLDPAHNQHDLFKIDIGHKPFRIRPGLTIREIDVDKWKTRYLKESCKTIRKAYLYESAFNLENHFNVLRFSPGLEEWALLMAFDKLLRENDKTDAIIFDMPPTALSLRFFGLPGITLVWLRELLKLRDLICTKKEIISRIRLGRFDFEQDHIRKKLTSMITAHTGLIDCFCGSRTRVHLVLNPDPLSHAESIRIHRHLGELGINVDQAVINRVTTDAEEDLLPPPITPLKMTKLPYSTDFLVGLPALQKYLDDNAPAFADDLSQSALVN